MPRLVILLLSLISTTSVFSQSKDSYNPIKVDLSLGYALPSGNGSKGGALFAFEPKYSFLDNLSVGLRFETALMARGVESSNGSTSTNIEIKASGSYIATGDYYFTGNRSFRPFVGTGMGIFRLAAATVATAGADVSDLKVKFGAMFRTGFEASWLRVGFEYNIIPDTKFISQIGIPTEFTYKNSYIGIKLGVCFGGKKKKV
jgi:outer membrane protein W